MKKIGKDVEKSLDDLKKFTWAVTVRVMHEGATRNNLNIVYIIIRS